MAITIIFVVALAGALLTAVVAQSKGRNFFGWFIYGALIWIIALPHPLKLGSDASALDERKISEGGKKCPDCAEIVKPDANICRFCGHKFDPRSDPPTAHAPLDPRISKTGGTRGVPIAYWIGNEVYETCAEAESALQQIVEKPSRPAFDPHL